MKGGSDKRPFLPLPYVTHPQKKAASLRPSLSTTVTSQYLGAKITKVLELALYEHSDAKTFVISQFIEKIPTTLLNLIHRPDNLTHQAIFLRRFR